jgi:hypothetical protein
MKSSAVFALATSAVFTLTVSAPAALYTLNPTQDTFVASKDPNNSFGAAGQLAVSGSTAYSSTGTQGTMESLLQFNLASVYSNANGLYGSGNWAITSMTLQLTNTSPQSNFFNGNAAGPGSSNVNFSGQFSLEWMQSDSWVAGGGTPAAPGTNGVTYNTLSSYLSAGTETLGTYSYTAATSGSNTWNLGLTSGFAADATAGNMVSLLALPVDSGVSFGVNSEDFGTVGNRPLLSVTVTPVPEPGTGGFAACLALAVLGIRRRYPARAV